MNTPTPEQTAALATFKSNTHLPGGGFHSLIVGLSCEFLLPFQQVRTVVKKSQTAIEQRIIDGASDLENLDITKEKWIDDIRKQLTELAKNNVPILEGLYQSERYLHLNNMIEQPLIDESERETLLATIQQTYEHEIYRGLKALLHTSSLQWELKKELSSMTHERRELFNAYPQYIEAITQLHTLWQQSLVRPLS